MSELINPPFDGSKPCPGCASDLRNCAALVHNFLNRCDIPSSKIREAKAYVKLYDLKGSTIPSVLTVPSPESEALLSAVIELVAATEGMTMEDMTIRWTPEVTERVNALIPKVAVASDAYNVISEQHYFDSRHCSGNDNILIESKGSKWAGHVNPDYTKAKYDYTVEIVSDTSDKADLVHTVCGTEYKIHDHFKDILKKDPTFYAKMRCKVCGVNAPWSQFENHIDD